MIKQLLGCATGVAVLISVPSVSMAQTPYAESQVTFQGTVEAIDHANRTVSIRGDQGNLVALDAPPTARRFNEIKVGEHITATYSDRISVRLKPASEPSVDRVIEPQTTSTVGTAPGGTESRQRVSTVTITGWTPADKTVNFRDVHG